MNINEELDKIIDKHKVDVSYVGRLESFKIETLALIERKMNEVVPENNYFYKCPNFEMCKKCIEKIKQNIKTVLEGK